MFIFIEIWITTFIICFCMIIYRLSHLHPYIPFSMIKCILESVINLISIFVFFNIALLEKPGADIQ